jgi:hypothetical protein
VSDHLESQASASVKIGRFAGGEPRRTENIQEVGIVLSDYQILFRRSFKYRIFIDPASVIFKFKSIGRTQSFNG